MMTKVMSDGDKLAATALYYNLVENVHADSDKIVCPFHADKNPSMQLDYTTGFWYCFGCQEGGKWEKLVSKLEAKLGNTSPLSIELVKSKILKHARSEHHITKVEQSPEVVKRRLRQAKVEAYDYYMGLKKTSWTSCDISDDESEVLAYMNMRGFTASSLEHAHAKYNYSRDYKLIFPIIDNGAFKGWVCRTTDKNVEKYRKYLYNKGFSHRNTLVGFYGKKSKGAQDYAILVEGFMDRLKLQQLGMRSVVALFSWKATQEQIEKLKNAGIKYVVSALDNDDCGKRGTEWLRKSFDVIRWPYIKGVKDPGDFDTKSFKKMYNRFKERQEKYLTSDKSRSV